MVGWRAHIVKMRLVHSCWVETHVVDDVSDYDIAPVNPPNDEYVSDAEVMEHTMIQTVIKSSLIYYNEVRL